MDKEIINKVLGAVSDEEIISLEQEAVRIPSFTYEEAKLAEYLADYLDNEGIEVDLLDVEDPFGSGRNSKQPVGIIRGDGSGTSLMFNGHMDHNPLVEGWTYDPFGGEIVGDYLYGRGSIDEKGGVVNLIIAGVALKRSGLRLKGDLLLCPVMGHKSGGIGTQHNLDKGIVSDVIINTESSGSGIASCGVGVVVARVTIHGKSVHFRTPEPHKSQAINPIAKLNKLISALGPNQRPVPEGGWLSFKADPDLPGYPQFSLDSISSEKYPNFDCTLQMQIRLIPGQNASTVHGDLKALLEQLYAEDPYFRYTLEVPPKGAWNFAPYKVSPEEPFVQSLIKAHEYVNGQPPVVGSEPRLGACGDANILANAGIPTVQYGPGSGRAHQQWPTADERIFIPELLAGARTMSLAAAEICGAY